jgi:hypothetical protein
MTDWAAWGTSVGTLVLAGATFAAIRSSNRSARIAERSLLAGLQPILVVARRDDPVEEVQFADGRTFKAGHGSALFHHDDHVIYVAVPLRNAGAGIAYLAATWKVANGRSLVSFAFPGKSKVGAATSLTTGGACPPNRSVRDRHDGRPAAYCSGASWVEAPGLLAVDSRCSDAVVWLLKGEPTVHIVCV